mgnify:CR=1 FL=1
MIIEAIQKINPNAEVVVRGSDINTCELEWHNGTPEISRTDIEAKMNEMANEPEQSNYAQQRRSAYPEIGDQLDMLWHTMDKDNELQHKFYDFYQTIKKVKVAYPKK